MSDISTPTPETPEAPSNPEDVTAGHVDQGSRAGSPEGTASVVEEIFGRATPRNGRPGATAVLDVESAKVVAFEFGEGDELHDHAARHPVIIQVLRGRCELTYAERTVELVPGRLVHLTPMLRHAVRAVEPSTLTVTMLLPH